MSWVLAAFADHAARLGAVWARFVQHHAKHRWFDIFVALLFGLLAPPILESHFVAHLIGHLGLGVGHHHSGVKEGS
jgi:hypothetical protein